VVTVVDPPEFDRVAIATLCRLYGMSPCCVDSALTNSDEPATLLGTGHRHRFEPERST
jgi:hypothetical protein